MSTQDPHKNAVTCFILRDRKLLLQERPSSKIWGKMLNGPGGKIEPGESSEEAAIREVYEETGLTLETFLARGTVSLHIPSPSPFLFNVDIFVATEFSGQPEGKEGRLSWHDRDDLPYERMWADQRYWLPAVLDGHSIHGTISYRSQALEISRLDLRIR